jgi:hypothetical protein
MLISTTRGRTRGDRLSAYIFLGRKESSNPLVRAMRNARPPGVPGPGSARWWAHAQARARQPLQSNACGGCAGRNAERDCYFFYGLLFKNSGPGQNAMGTNVAMYVVILYLQR